MVKERAFVGKGAVNENKAGVGWSEERVMGVLFRSKAPLGR